MKLLGRITTEKIIIAMLLLELVNVIIQTVLTLSAEISQDSNKITITFNNSLIMVVAFLGIVFFIIGVLAFFNYQREYYTRKLKELQEKYLNDTTELAQLHEINKSEYLEQIHRLQEKNITISASLRKLQAEKLNLSSAYSALASKYELLVKKSNSDDNKS